MHIEFLLEEPSAEAFLQQFLPKVLPAKTTWNPVVFQGKPDLLDKLAARLQGYRMWMPEDWRIVVLIDEDRQNCVALKSRLEAAAQAAKFPTKSRPRGDRFVVLNRIAVEELEAWFFGDIPALAVAYPGVSPNLGQHAAYRDVDAIAGGTWEALERVLQRAGYFGGGLPKIEVAREIARHMDASRNTSRSFRQFTTGLAAL